MQYHTLSLSQQPGAQVVVIAYSGSRPISQLTQASNVKIRSVSEAPAWMQRFPRPLQLIFKVLYLLFQLAWLMLVSLPSPQAILVQTPPAIPTMAVCWLAAVRHRARLLFDWHNFGYTILALTQGKQHWLVKLARSYEHYWGRSAHAHFCVTRAMQQELQVWPE
jgi:beta-1,4-mannosyltransferase